MLQLIFLKICFHRWLVDEHRCTKFPFEINKEFQMAIALAASCFKVAVDGKHLLTYDFKTTKQQLPRAFTGHHPIFEKITGFKMFALNGMTLCVTKVDHVPTKESCEFYEIFSNPNYAC
jgi:hypothetical protein